MSLHDKNQSLHTEIIAENCGHFCCAERPHRRKKVLFSPLHQMILSSITTHKRIFISLNSYFSFTELTSGGNYEEAGAAIKMREKSHLLEEDSFS